MSLEEIRVGTQGAWDEFYSWGRVWSRASRSVESTKARLAFVLISKLYRQMYANTGIATDSARVQRSAETARLLGLAARRLFTGQPMPELEMPRAADADDAGPDVGQLACCGSDVIATVIRVLFVGNSLTAANDLPGPWRRLGAAAGARSHMHGRGQAELQPPGSLGRRRRAARDRARRMDVRRPASRARRRCPNRRRCCSTMWGGSTG